MAGDLTPRLRLAVFDVDGTLRRARDPWVHLHNHLGVADRAREFIPRWRRGEISYDEWASLDASLWRGVSRETILAALDTNPLRNGARELLRWFTSRSIPCVGISTGLSVFNDVTGRELGIHETICNGLHFCEDVCTGEVTVLVREDNKREVMSALLERYSTEARDVVAFGDGTADIPILTMAGLGIAVCPANHRVRACTNHVVESEPIEVAIHIVEAHFRSGEKPYEPSH